jgi:hypothetical protein
VRTGPGGPVLHALAEDIKRIQRRDDAPAVIWLSSELFAGLLDEVCAPDASEVVIPVYSPVTRRIETVPVRRMGGEA